MTKPKIGAAAKALHTLKASKQNQHRKLAAQIYLGRLLVESRYSNKTSLTTKAKTLGISFVTAHICCFEYRRHKRNLDRANAPL